MTKRNIGFAILTLLVLAVVIVRSNGSNFFLKQIFSAAMPVDYFTAYGHITPKLYQVSGSVYAFERDFTRSMLVVTPAGVAVFDTFDSEHVTALKTALKQEFPEHQVRWVVFSHNHLDHIRGSDLFPNAEVIGHKDVNQFVRDWPEAGRTVAPVTRAIQDDQTLNFGGVTVEALYMPLSHSHTLYGFHVPTESTVFAADMMFVNAVPPFGFPDFYYPGYVRALDRLIALEAQHYIPSHMDRGGLNDLVAFRDMTVDFQETVKNEFLAISPKGGSPSHGMKHAITNSYDKLHAKYGDLHGFDGMFVAKFGRHFGGSYLGY